jgi:hypothetical protein
MVATMALEDLPEEFESLHGVAIAAIRRTYDINAERYDAEVGDDGMVFGTNVYRNSWYLLEQAIETLEAWSSARPQGSLVITGAGLRVHVYRYGEDADVDLEGFRLDGNDASATQRNIAESNTLQLRFPGFEATSDRPVVADHELCELVIVHAGNPDDGCCGIWIGAPIAAEEITRSPWSWIEPLWVAEPLQAGVAKPDPTPTAGPRHHELPEPVIALETIQAVDSEEL